MEYYSLFGTRLFSMETTASYYNSSSFDGCKSFIALPPGFLGEIPKQITADAAAESSVYQVSYIFYNTAADIKSKQEAELLLVSIDSRTEGKRCFLWDSCKMVFYYQAEQKNFAVIGNFCVMLPKTITFSCLNNTSFVWDTAKQRFQFSSNARFHFSNYTYGDNPFSDIYIDMETSVLSFLFTVQDTRYFDKIFTVGFDYGYMDNNDQIQFISFYPIKDYCDNSFHLSVALDLHVPANSVFQFYEIGHSFFSQFVSVYGEKLMLTGADNAGFRFPRRPYNGSLSVLILNGQYKLSSPCKTHQYGVLCGASGTEYFVLPDHKTICFGSGEIGYGAYAPKFPSAVLSIDDFVHPAGTLALTDTYTTSWVQLPKGTKYYSQPSENPYYSGEGDLLSLAPLYTTLDTDTGFFPMVPGMAIDSDFKRSYERTAISPTRTAILAKLQNLSASYSMIRSRFLNTAGSLVSMAASSGYLLQLNEAGVEKILLSESICFSAPPDELVHAFNSAGMLLVAADYEALPFAFRIKMAGWDFNFKIGETILIVKSLEGKLYDNENKAASLVGNVSLWSCKESFSTPKAAKIAEYLMQFFENAFLDTADSTHYAPLIQIASNPHWKGYLFVDTPLNEASCPEELKILFSNDSARDTILLKYFFSDQIKLAPGNNGPVFEGSAEYYGFASYHAPGFQGHPLNPFEPETFEFRSLALAAVFEKGNMTYFNNTSQLVFSDFFGMKPKSSLDAAVLLHGKYVQRGQKPVFCLETEQMNTLLFQTGAPFTNIQLDRVVLTNQEDVSMFTASGHIQFEVLSPADILSYDKLLFSEYTFIQKEKRFESDYSNISFNIADSIVRDSSFAKAFHLNAEHFIRDASGFHTIRYEHFNGKMKEFAGGFQYKALLGTLGHLSSDSPLSVHLLIGWDCNNKFLMGIKLPSVFPVENVLAMTTGQTKLSFEQDSGFVLSLSDIALKALGLLKLPPNGVISMAIYNGGWFSAYIQNDDRKGDVNG